MQRLAFLVLLAACGQTSAPGGEGIQPIRGEGLPDTSICNRELASRVRGLYEHAAKAEGVTPEALEDYLSANVTMVLNDCRANPPEVSQCVAKAESASALEARCLIPLDDQGETEAKQFSG